ncbi:hypothetical protein NDU88_008316, partial [Pleurodeles waltl]
CTGFQSAWEHPGWALPANPDGALSSVRIGAGQVGILCLQHPATERSGPAAMKSSSLFPALVVQNSSGGIHNGCGFWLYVLEGGALGAQRAQGLDMAPLGKS